MADAWNMWQTGFRIDSETSTDRTLTLQGDLFSSRTGHRFTLPDVTVPPTYESVIDDTNRQSGGNIMAKMQWQTDNNSEWILSTYIDNLHHRETTYGEERNTFDLDIQQRFSVIQNHEITWGLEYRFLDAAFARTPYVNLAGKDDDKSLFSAFIQDNISLFHDTTSLTLGSKFEHNEFTGFEIQPTARLLWTPAPSRAFWGAVSRAVRTPSEVENSGWIQSFTNPPIAPFITSPFLIQINGDNNINSETLIAYEFGYREAFSSRTIADITLFYNNYKMLRTGEGDNIKLIGGFPPNYILVPFTIANKMKGETYGVEMVLDIHPQPWWRLSIAYSYLSMHLSLDSASTDQFSDHAESRSPENQLSIRSSMNFSDSIDCDLWWRYVDKLEDISIADYTTLDLRLAWRPVNQQHLEIAAVGRNLLEKSHREYKSELFIDPPAYMERSFFGKISWAF